MQEIELEHVIHVEGHIKQLVPDGKYPARHELHTDNTLATNVHCKQFKELE